MIMSWNLRGLNNSEKCREIATHLQSLNPDISILIETRVKQNKVISIRNKLGGKWSYIDNYNNLINVEFGFFWIAIKSKLRRCLASTNVLFLVSILKVGNGECGALLYMLPIPWNIGRNYGMI